jgi:alkylation response protein AidB-like acyl-CoA dehydrogenase
MQKQFNQFKIRAVCAIAAGLFFANAAWAVDRLQPDEALLAAHVAKGYASRAGLAVVEATVQMFGGIAITWEQASHLRLRRALFDRQVAGDEAVNYAEVARLRLAHPELV